MELSKTKATLIGSLKDRKMREKHGLFTAEGEKCVADTLGAFEVECLVALAEWAEANRALTDGLPLFTASRSAMARISSLSTPPTVIAVFRMPPKSTSVPVLGPGLSLLLDGIQDPGNLGTIVRTADWFGFTRIYASPDTVSIFNPKAVQATMGSLKRVEIVYCDLPGLIDRSKPSHVYGTLLEGEDIFRVKLEEDGAVVMGNEGKGISPEMRKRITNGLFIPPANMTARPESLNVAIAAAITMARFRGR